MEEIEVTEGCEAEGKAISEIRGTSSVAALRRADGGVQPQPPSSTVLERGDVLVAMGTKDALERLESLFTPRRAESN
jgi:Trk K+ transport system NAD-binding subunit